MQKLAISASEDTTETITVIDSASATAGGTVTGGVGVTCVGAPNAVTLTCSGAHYGTSAGAGFGEAFSTTATAGTSGGNANAVVTTAIYAGTGLQLAQTGAVWSISNASAFNSATGTFGYTKTGSSGSGTFTLTDVLYTYAETATLSSTGLAIAIQQNPNSAFNTTTQIATATIDVAGTGVITFTDGTTETVAGGLVGY